MSRHAVAASCDSSVVNFGALLVLLVAVASVPRVEGQWAFGTPKFNEVFSANTATVEEEVLSGEYVVEQLFPSKFQIDKDTYQYVQLRTSFATAVVQRV